MTDLNQSVISLHNVARILEETIGKGKLSEDVRACADRLNEVIKFEKDHTIKEPQ